MGKKLTLQHCVNSATEKNGKCLSKKYVNSKTIMLWECEKGHQWKATYNYIQQNHWCNNKECAQEKKKQTCFKKYGVEHLMQSEGIREKVKQTNLKQYGKENPSQSKEIKEKKKQTTLKNHGVENPFQNEEIKKKIKQTNLDRHGVEYPMQSKEIKEKRTKTYLKNYGVEHPMQNPEIALRAAKAQNNVRIFEHWFSREDVVCTAGYEIKTVEYFNKNQIDYNWQVQTFLMPDGKTFRPDCYLPDEDLWIEIKGYFRDDAQEKWEWFHKEYPNSELWDEEKLKEMGIL